VNLQLNDTNTELSNTLEDLKRTQAQLVATEKAKETEVIRRRISQDIHDDISSGLTRIAWLSETARELSAHKGNGEIDTTLTKIVSSSRETIERLGEIIWAINPDKDNLEGFFAYLRTYIMHYLEGTDYKIRIDFPEQKLDVRFNPDLKRTLFLVIKEAIHNVVKHSGAQSIHISFHCIGQRFEILIADDGKGFDPASVNSHSNGLRNMRERIEAVGGTFSVITGNGDGTKVMLSGEIYS
jgi:signal transduction histidine kinase